MARRQRHRQVIAALAAPLAIAVLLSACGTTNKGDDASGGPGSEGGSTTTAPGAASPTTAGQATGTTVSGVGTTTTTNSATAAQRSTTTSIARTPTTAAKATSAPKVQVTTPPATSPSEPVQPGGSLTVLMPSEGNGFDPTKGTGSAIGGDMQRMFAVYDALVYQDPRTGNVVPETAESMTTSDAKVWTLKLRPNIRFTDGAPYDAAALKFNWDRHAEPRNASPWAATLKTLSYEIVDSLTVRITLMSPAGQFPRVVSRQLSYIASPVALTAAGTQAFYNDKPVGAGPFVLKSWSRDGQLVLERNPQYWNAPKPYLDRLIFKPVADEVQRTAALRAGEGDLDFTTYATTAADLTKDMVVTASPSIGSTLFYMNLARPPFNDLSVRKAMGLVIDPEQINRTVFGGALETPRSFFPANNVFSDPARTFAPPNQAEAQRLVNEYVARTGSDITFTFSTTGAAAQVAMAQVVQTMVQKLSHVRVEIHTLTTNQFVAELVQKSFDVAAFTYLGVDPEPEFSETVLSSGTRNFQSYSDAAVDRAVADSRTSTDPAARAQALETVQQQLLADMPFFVLNRNTAFWAGRPSLRDLATFDDGGLLSDRVWVKTR